MKAFVFSLFLLVSFSARALYVTEIKPQGTEVGPDVSEIFITFSEDIVPLGSQQVKDEHKGAMKFGAGIDCDLRYQGTKSVLCKLKKRLLPGTKYDVEIKTGFTGAVPTERLSYEFRHSFQTAPLSIVSYSVSWRQKVPVIDLTLSYRIKDQPRSGTIQCPTRTIPVSFEPVKEKGADFHLTVKGKGELKKDETCVFYFDKPLFYSDSPGSFVPAQKVIIDPSVTTVGRNTGDIQKNVRCLNNYQLSTNLFSYSIPYLRCEVNDGVALDIYFDETKKVDLKKLITVSPNDGIEVSATSEGIFLSGFKTPEKTYLININRNLPTTEGKPFASDIRFQVETVNNPPLLSAAKITGVIEKDGPWLIPYSALNIKSVELAYTFASNPPDIVAGPLTPREKRVIPLNTPLNENHLHPLDVKKLATETKFKAGVFSGTMKVHEVEKKFQEAEALLFKDQDYALAERRGFTFNYLFTDIGLHVKQGRKGLLVWAFSLKTGRSLPGTEIRVYRRGAGQETLTTDQEGLASFPEFVLGENEKLSVVAIKEEDISYIDNQSWSSGISKWDFNFGGSWQGPQNLILDVISERPLYLPGERVNLKIFVRKFIPDSMELTETGKKVRISIFNSRGEEVVAQEINLNDYGTGILHYDLPKKAPTGRYSVYLQEGGSTIMQDSVFQVEEFRKPEFKVAMEDENDAIKGKLTYFKGGPVREQEGEAAVLFKKIPFVPKRQEHKRMAYPEAVRGSYGNSELRVISRSSVTSDKNGEFVVSKPTDIKEYGLVIVEGIFKDENGGSISGRSQSLVNPFDFIPGIDLSKWFYNSGEAILPDVVLLNRDGLHQTKIEMTLTLIKVDYIYERRLGSGNYFYYDSHRDEKVITTCSFKTAPDLKSCPLTAKDAGYYEISVSVVDGKKKAERARTGTYVYAKGEFLGFEAANHDRINLNVEKTELKLGDKLKVMAISPLQDAEALITLERDGILHKEKVSFQGNVLLYEKEISDEKFIPGFYVSVVIIKGRTSEKIDGKLDLGKPAFKIGYQRVEVANSSKRLTTVVQPSRKQVEPGSMMEATVEVKDHKGKPAMAELAIAVVDDALLTLTGAYRDNYDVLDTFYSLGSLGVENFQTLTQLIGRRTFGKKGANAGGGGGFEIRSEFKNTAIWIPQVETDKSGKHRFKFKVPDNLTTWKIIAVAVDKTHRFGFGEEEFVASKSLMVEPALPNFLVEGDKFNGKVVVTNRSGKKQNLTIEAKSNEVSIKPGQLSLPLDHEKKDSVLFSMAAPRPGEASLTVTAKGDSVSDGFRTTIPVLSNTETHVFGTRGVVGEKEVAIPLSINPEARTETLALNLQYSTTAIQGMDEVFRYVLGYPYGCWEQKLTKAYFLVQYEAMKSLLTYRFPEEKGPIRASVQKLLDEASDYQTPSGGMRYYPGGSEEADTYLSIFTGFAFVVMKELGYKVDQKVSDNLKAYLKNLLTSDLNWNSWYYNEARISMKAQVLAILSDMGEKGMNSFPPVSKIFMDRNQLDLMGLSFFAGFTTQSESFKKESKHIVDRLESLRVTSSGKATYKEPATFQNESYKFWNYTSTRSVCTALLNLTKFSQDKLHLSSVVRTILEEMKAGRWYNTQENIYCFEALRRYVKKFESPMNEAALEVKVASKLVSEKPSIEKGIHAVSLKAPTIDALTKNVSLRNKKGEVYYSTILRYDTPSKGREKINQGFSLAKKFYKLEQNGTSYSWLEIKDQVIQLKRGDLMKISLDVVSEGDRYQVMLNDQLAGCLEPVNTQLATTSAALGALLTQGTGTFEWESPYYRGNGFEYLDLRHTAAQFYARKLPKGKFHVEYLVQTIATGEYTMPEATIEEMYYPDVRGTEKGRKIVVTE